eukprot:5312848-Pyramimonas_sp.AAC.1
MRFQVHLYQNPIFSQQTDSGSTSWVRVDLNLNFRKNDGAHGAYCDAPPQAANEVKKDAKKLKMARDSIIKAKP